MVDITVEDFWKKFDLSVHELAPTNKELIEKREILQKKLMRGTLPTKVKNLLKMNTSNF